MFIFCKAAHSFCVLFLISINGIKIQYLRLLYVGILWIKDHFRMLGKPLVC